MKIEDILAITAGLSKDTISDDVKESGTYCISDDDTTDDRDDKSRNAKSLFTTVRRYSETDSNAGLSPEQRDNILLYVSRDVLNANCFLTDGLDIDMLYY